MSEFIIEETPPPSPRKEAPLKVKTVKPDSLIAFSYVHKDTKKQGRLRENMETVQTGNTVNKNGKRTIKSEEEDVELEAFKEMSYMAKHAVALCDLSESFNKEAARLTMMVVELKHQLRSEQTRVAELECKENHLCVCLRKNNEELEALRKQMNQNNEIV